MSAGGVIRITEDKDWELNRKGSSDANQEVGDDRPLRSVVDTDGGGSLVEMAAMISGYHCT